MPRNMFSSEFVSLADMYLAYRKAKSDAFFNNLHPSAISYAKFEQNLQKNIEELHIKLVKGIAYWWEDMDFIGHYLYVPKSLDDSAWNNSEGVHYRSVDPNRDWEQRFIESGKKRLEANYRLIIAATVEYQIISALWIIKVGHKFEAQLDKKLSYGNRLRRKRYIFEEFGPLNGPVNQDSLGLFSPYFTAYRNWRQKGLDTMRELIMDGKSVTAITMDLAGFYHNASPHFLLRPSFLKAIGVEVDANERKLTQLLLSSINHWYSNTPDYHEREDGALPVGLSASKIISNVLLYELDNQVADSIQPAYYGRYVDDIFLVFETPEDMLSGDAVLRYLSQNIECLKIDRKKGHRPGLKLKFGYAADSDLRFTASKQKIFSLSSEHGLDLINQIASQIRTQSSEYRMLPEIPNSSVAMAEKALLASPDASLIADALRKADVVSIRRLGLSLLIRDIESYSSDLFRDEWRDLRKEFYGLVERYLVTPKGLFDLFGYFSRVFRLMVSNYDFDQAEGFVNKVSACFNLIEKTTTNDSEVRARILLCKAYFSKSLLQTALQSSTTRKFDKWAKLRRLLKVIFEFSDSHYISITKRDLQSLSNQLLLADLGARPYKEYWYYSQTDDANPISVPKKASVRKVLRLGLIRKFRKSAQLKVPHWPALVFPTRPLSVQEIALVCPSVLDDNQLFKDSILGLRGAKTQNWVKIGRSVTESDGCYLSVTKQIGDKVYVALTNFETTENQFDAALKRHPDRSLARYEKVNRLINDILRSNPRSDYVVFPECSLPRRWAIGISGKLAKQSISLIAGIEYYDHKKGANIVRNDCLVSLATLWPGYPSNFLFMQPKLHPSHSEKAKLRIAKKKQYVPMNSAEILPIYEHGDFYFGVLICSDMTNPENRVRFQGKVDSLFVLEWNPDVKTFSFLVEGAAHDVHTFVVQVNNRMFGDSRVRAPYRVDYKRDSVRIKGGIEDYFVIAEIDYKSLRKFQRRARMNDENSEFKPVPIGFKMSPLRKKKTS